MRKRGFILRIFLGLSIAITLSCSKKDESEIYYFTSVNYIDKVKYFDYNGNLLNNNSKDFASEDFIFSKNFHFPYNQIEILNDNSFIGKLTDAESKSEYGYIESHNDSVFFYIDNEDIRILNSVMRNDSIIFPGYGVKYIYNNYSGEIHSTAYLHISQLGIPSIKDISANPEEYPSDSSDYIGSYIQQFEYIYVK